MRSKNGKQLFAFTLALTAPFNVTSALAGQDQKPVFSSSGDLAGTFPLGETFIEFFDVDGFDVCNGTVLHGPKGGLTETIMPALATGVANLTKVTLTVNDGQIVTFSKWRTDTVSCGGTFSVTDTDICTDLPGGSCEEWNGGPLEAGWSISDPNGILTQRNNHLILTGSGPAASVEITLPTGTKCLAMQDLHVSMSPGADPFVGEVYAAPIGGGPEFVAVTNHAVFDGTLGACCGAGNCIETTATICSNLGNVFQSEGTLCSGIDACDMAVPTLSDWGLVAMSLLILTAGTLVQRRRTSLATTT